MLSGAGFAVFIGGTRNDGNDESETATGMFEEYEIAMDLGMYPVPVGATGGASAELWTRVDADFGDIYPEAMPREAFERLNDPDAGVDGWLEAILEVVEALTPHH